MPLEALARKLFRQPGRSGGNRGGKEQMRIFAKQPFLGAAVTVVLALLIAGAACAVEDGLLGVRIGASSRQLIADRSFGQPSGILFPSGSGLLYQSVAAAPGAALPDFGQQAVTDAPTWILPVRAATLTERQLQWAYDFTRTKGVALGIILNTEGGDAVVTDVIVAGYPQRLKGKPAPVRTQRGIVLGSTFAEVLKRYGYPPLIEIYAPTTGTAARAGGAVAGGGAMRARAGAGGGAGGGGMRAGMGMRGGGRRGGGMGGGAGGARGPAMGGGGAGGRGGRRFGAAPPGLSDVMPHPGTTRTAQAPEFELSLTAMGGPGMRGGGMRGGAGGGGGGTRGGGPGMRGGGMGGGGGGMRGGGGGGMRGGGGGGMRGGGMRGGGGGGGRGGLPPLGAAAATATGPVDRFTAQAVVDHVSVGFSRDCILTYEGIAFTLHDMKVYRIHVSE